MKRVLSLENAVIQLKDRPLNQMFKWICCALLAIATPAVAQTTVADSTLQRIYRTIRTPFKYGRVVVPPDAGKMVDSPSVFRKDGKWYMTYIVFDGKGYETWLAESADLLSWETLGRILSNTRNTWDANQKAGYLALLDWRWGGSYQAGRYDGRYWLSYLGGASQGYEAGMLGIGIASSQKLIEPAEWTRELRPVLLPTDKDARWYDNVTIYKSTVVEDPARKTGYRFVMYYNAKGKTSTEGKGDVERIAMAVSEDMRHWQRFGQAPVIDHQTGISGDAWLAKIGDVYVMFYFGAFWKPGAFERFACSYDLVHWTDWTGPDLISPSESYDDQYAHKPCVVVEKGIVYHFYCAVNKKGERTIALATSRDLGRSSLTFPEK
ncbi:protein of unknown function [Siphonobacter aquaeclarae]|uniref:Glycosyl hydrolases family 43 n=2 Tax=Siphonobacter aquaeclarae TaxID=563176 RepID=A0A1G9KLM7_9BACT|nr:protein of unknown function [Siphonobacter aquaeclarae]